jgi:hypothetical protein
MASVTRSGRLTGAAKAELSAYASRRGAFGVEIGFAEDKVMAMTLRVDGETLSVFLGSQTDGDFGLLGRNISLVVKVEADGLTLVSSGMGAKLGRSILQPVPGTDDWLVGPLAIPAIRPSTPLDGHLRPALLPLIWRDAVGLYQQGRIRLQALANRPAEIGATSLSKAGPAKRPTPQRIRALPQGLFDLEPSLPLPEPKPRAVTLTPEVPLTSSARVRRTVARVRLATGADGRIGLTIPVAEMEALWAGRPNSAQRPCRLILSGKDLVVLPADDPAARKSGVTLVLKLSTGNRWYGRTSRPESDTAQSITMAVPIARDGSGFEAEIQPGRVVLRGAVGRALVADQHPAVRRLARASRMISEALIMVHAAREEGRADIDILDASGTALLLMPREAVAARIRGDGFSLSPAADG